MELPLAAQVLQPFVHGRPEPGARCQQHRLERVPVQTRTYVRFTELYRWPLVLALLAFTAEMALAARRGPLPA